MQVGVRWLNDMKMEAKTQNGYKIHMDGPPHFGEQNNGARPMEMLLMGLGGCMTVDVVGILKKMRQIIYDCSVQIKAKRAPEPPKIFTHIHLHFILKGDNLENIKIIKALNLSAHKYCSASMMLGKMANISHDFEVL